MKNKKYKNLSAVLDFLQERHPDAFTWGAVAAKVGCSIQSISHMFVRDDMRLSTAERLAKCYGYELVLSWPKKLYQNGWEPEIQQRSFPNAGNLTGLAEYIVKSNWSIRRASRETGVSREVLQRALSTGDITMGYLTQLEEVLAIKVQYHWEKQ